MFNRFYKLSQAAKISGAVLMSALLLWATSGVQVASQVSPLPKRGDIVRGLQHLAQILTVSEGDILDVENSGFSSHPRLTAAYIPLYPVSRSWERLLQLLVDKEPVGPVNIGALYLENDFPGWPKLKAGFYTLQLDNDLNLIAVDLNGEGVVIGKAECHCTFGPPQQEPSIRLGQFTIIEETPLKILIVLALVATTAAVKGCADQGCNCNCNCGGGGG